jgi:hypothetical protein
MKDLTDYVIDYEGTKEFYVDVHDVGTDMPLWEDGERFTFECEGVKYVGWAELEDGMNGVSYVNVMKTIF